MIVTGGREGVRLPRRDLVALVFIALAAVAVTWQVTVGSYAMLPTGMYLRIQPWRAHVQQFPEFERPENPILDAVQQFYPWRLYAARTVAEGDIPLWNTQMLSGTPFVGNNQSAVFYPETWLHYAIDPLKALGWATLVFYLVAGWGMYLFLRIIGARPTAGVIGAVCFIFGGFFTGWLTFPALRSVAAWLPLALIGVELAVRRRRGAWLGLTALAVGLQFLAGHLHISIYVLLTLGAYAVFRLAVLAREGERRIALQLAALTVAAMITGGLLAGCQLGPTFEFTQFNYRVEGLNYADQVHHALALPQALLALMPDIFGNPVDGNHWGPELNTLWGKAYRSYMETSWYLGIAPLLLALTGLCVRRDGQRWFWLCVGIFALLLAFGTPANALLRWAVPGYDQLAGVGRALVLVCTAGAILAGLGAEALMRRGGEQKAMTGLLVVTFVLLVGGLAGGMSTWVFTGSLEAAGLPFELGGYTLMQIGRFVLLLGLSAGLAGWALRSNVRVGWYALALLTVLDLGSFAHRFTPQGRTEYLQVQPEIVAAMHGGEQPSRMATVGPDFLNRMAPNTQMIFGLESMQGSESLIFAPWHRLQSDAQSERYGFEQVDPAHPLLEMMAVRWLASAVRIDDPGWRLEGEYELLLYENERAVPRAFVPTRVEPPADEDAVFAAITAADADPRVVHLSGVSRWEAPEPVEVRIEQYRANSVLVRGPLPADTWLVLADVAYPGWRAFSDEGEADLLRSDLVRRAVHLERATEAVRFLYLPASFRIGMFLSLLALGGLAGLCGYLLAGRRPE